MDGREDCVTCVYGRTSIRERWNKWHTSESDKYRFISSTRSRWAEIMICWRGVISPGPAMETFHLDGIVSILFSSTSRPLYDSILPKKRIIFSFFIFLSAYLKYLDAKLPWGITATLFAATPFLTISRLCWLLCT